MQMVDQLKHEYMEWLNEKIIFPNLPKAIEITTPFLNSNQDYIQIYAVNNDDQIKLTDDGNTLNELYLAGFDYSTGKRRDMINHIIKSYGVTLSNGEITVQSTIKSFAQRKHALIQAILKVNDMLLLNRRNVKSLFIEDVGEFLENNDVRAVPDITLTGKSGYNQKIDFAIPASKKAGERFIQTVNNLEKAKVQSTLFMWSDIKGARKEGSSLYVFINDAEREANNEHIKALEEYAVNVVKWTKKNMVVPALSA